MGCMFSELLLYDCFWHVVVACPLCEVALWLINQNVSCNCFAVVCGTLYSTVYVVVPIYTIYNCTYRYVQCCDFQMCSLLYVWVAIQCTVNVCFGCCAVLSCCVVDVLF